MDVECTFSILQKSQQIPEYSIHYLDIATINDFLLTCCVLHKMIAKGMEKWENQVWVGWADLLVEIQHICMGTW